MTDVQPTLNTLTFTVSTDNWHCSPVFELVVDGKPLPEWLDDGNDGVPNWLTLEGLPPWPEDSDDALNDRKLVTVCGCGVPGCGHSHCSVRVQDDTVVFEHFGGDAKKSDSPLRFTFAREQYEAVCRAIRERCRLTRA